MLKDYLKENILLTDGAMGTYFSQLSGKDANFSEFANRSNYQLIEKIHKEYIESGAKLIRTNTFSLNSRTMGIERSEVKELIGYAWENAKRAVGSSPIFIGASIGPVPCCSDEDLENEGRLDEYKFIVDCFLEQGAEVFVFETFSDTEDLLAIAEYIKNKNKNAFILCQFAISADGRTRRGIYFDQIIEVVAKAKEIDAYGFNCGTGPSHLLTLLKKSKLEGDFLSILPNAGFPQILNERTVYSDNAAYFGKTTAQFREVGIKILGGCCGTTPVHIRALRDSLELSNHSEKGLIIIKETHTKEVGSIEIKTQKNESIIKLEDKNDITLRELTAKNNETLPLDNEKPREICDSCSTVSAFALPIAVELSSPQDCNTEKFIEGAKLLKKHGVSYITIPDSPLGRMKADSVILAAKARREAGIEAIPHVCCRDRNMLSLQSSILGGYIENVRNVLAVTGDPVPHAARNEVSSVFNLNSIRLIKMLQDMNETLFMKEPISIYAALNLNVKNKEAELRRMRQKAESANVTFFTQPIFDDEAIGFLKEIKSSVKAKIFAGIIPLVSIKNANFLNNEMPGITIPDRMIHRFEEGMDRETAQDIGVELALEIIHKVKDSCDGLYLITPFHRVSMICSIVDKLKEN